eukprot:scaffold210625_cov19-Tisochrysis_lutea.AAC.1
MHLGGGWVVAQCLDATTLASICSILWDRWWLESCLTAMLNCLLPAFCARGWDVGLLSAPHSALEAREQVRGVQNAQ